MLRSQLFLYFGQKRVSGKNIFSPRPAPVYTGIIKPNEDERGKNSCKFRNFTISKIGNYSKPATDKNKQDTSSNQ